MESDINLDNYLTTKEAAQCLEVSTTTVRNWTHKSGIDVLRHPLYGYYLFTINDLKSILDAVHGIPGYRTI
jgi:DNA-binding transcriptional MerR regulator